MNSPEFYQNQILLLKQALMFYADSNNYKKQESNKLFSLVEMDNGAQARFAIEKLNEQFVDINDIDLNEPTINVEEFLKTQLKKFINDENTD